MSDHYKTLGLSSAATKDEIKAAFRRCALRFHPDRHSQSPQSVRDSAARRFRQASEAYEVLVDDRRRADYDLARRSPFRGSSSSNPGAQRYGYGGGGSGSGSGGGGADRTYRYRYGFGGGGGGNGWSGWVSMEFNLRHLTMRRFLTSVGFAGALLGGAFIMERCVQEIWKRNNSGKSFEEAMDSIDKVKVRKEDN